jgi:hypothetical protein
MTVLGEGQKMAIPNLIIISDYDGYFEALVRRWYERKQTQSERETVYISAGPYRATAVTARVSEDGRCLSLDFYSALRTGFGGLSSVEVDAIIAEWL